MKDDVARIKNLRIDLDGKPDNRRIIGEIKRHRSTHGDHWGMVKGVNMKGHMLYVDVDNIIAGERVQRDLHRIPRFLGLSTETKCLPQRYVVAITGVSQLLQFS